MNPKVDAYINKAKTWKEEIETLRAIALDCKLTEELKWGCPCYTYEGTNLVLIHVFREYCALLFFKGALMKDPKGILVQQTENVQSARQLRFTSAQEITKLKAVVKAYIREAMAVQKAGLKVEMKKTEEFAMPEELQNKFDEDRAFKKAFEKLTPGRQRAYILHYAGAKQPATRVSRIEKSMPLIFEGLGLNDRAPLK
ncbi:MAG TPA: DUF1801 domain-containing protein [Burkholderiaceae bacterium]|jgi:uncharacterized protein YdeI (YjbR/CyaY-like superfamily)